jgi:hypothetical protein
VYVKTNPKPIACGDITPKLSCRAINKRARGARSINSRPVCSNARYVSGATPANCQAELCSEMLVLVSRTECTIGTSE